MVIHAGHGCGHDHNYRVQPCRETSSPSDGTGHHRGRVAASTGPPEPPRPSSSSSCSGGDHVADAPGRGRAAWDDDGDDGEQQQQQQRQQRQRRDGDGDAGVRAVGRRPCPRVVGRRAPRSMSISAAGRPSSDATRSTAACKRLAVRVHCPRVPLAGRGVNVSRARGDALFRGRRRGDTPALTALGHSCTYDHRIRETGKRARRFDTTTTTTTTRTTTTTTTTTTATDYDGGGGQKRVSRAATARGAKRRIAHARVRIDARRGELCRARARSRPVRKTTCHGQGISGRGARVSLAVVLARVCVCT